MNPRGGRSVRPAASHHDQRAEADERAATVPGPFGCQVPRRVRDRRRQNQQQDGDVDARPSWSPR